MKEFDELLFFAHSATVTFKNTNSYKGKPETKRVDIMWEIKPN